MFRDVNKLSLYAVICFILGIMLLMLNVLSGIFNLIFAILELTGLILLLIKKIQDYIIFKKEIKNAKEDLVIDMTLSTQGTFEIDNSSITKNKMKEFKILLREKFLPILILVALIILTAYFTYNIIQNLFI